jgi:hypothetical protein
VARGTGPVSGYSGITKSSVVNELQPVLMLPRGLFAAGKFDQQARHSLRDPGAGLSEPDPAVVDEKRDGARPVAPRSA